MFAEWMRKRMARLKGMDAAALGDWHTREWLHFSIMLAGRIARGLFVKVRLGAAPGLVLCGPRVVLYHPRGIRAGRGLNLEEGCEITGLSKRGIELGTRCTVGRFAAIRPTNILVGEAGEGLKMGDESNIGPYAYVGCSGFIEIGNRVMMGPRVNLLAERHAADRADVPMKSLGVERSFIRIEDDCWIGANATILAGVTVGHGSIVGAGAVVTRDVPPFSVIAGVPARVLRTRV
jgi:acetyltransferase-like isoleucine patch superfamily enzyme